MHTRMHARTWLYLYKSIINRIIKEKIFKSVLLWSPWQPEFFMEHNYLKEFEIGPPKEHSCEIS